MLPDPATGLCIDAVFRYGPKFVTGRSTLPLAPSLKGRGGRIVRFDVGSVTVGTCDVEVTVK